MKLSDIINKLLYSFRNEQELIDSIKELNKKFTSQRDLITDYLNDERLVSAYAIFYGLTNYQKLEKLIKLSGLNNLQGKTLYDIGSGTGSFAFAWNHLLKGRVFGIELSSIMRKQAKCFVDHESVDFFSDLTEIENDSVMLFGHSLNEMGAKKALNYIKRISPQTILFIEPGTMQSFHELKKVREALVDYSIQYPCPKPHVCPMSQDDWCHQYLFMDFEPELERLMQMASIDRKLSPVCFHVYSKINLNITRSARLVRYYKESKHAIYWQVCVDNKLYDFEVAKRGLSKARVKELLSFHAGMSIEYSVIKQLDDKKLRVEIK